MNSTVTESPESLPPADPFLESIAELEAEFQTLRDRYHQVGDADAARAELRQRQKLLKGRGKSPETKQELAEIAEKLGELEVVLESQLLTMEPFWTAVRFGGLGVLIGWGLKTWLG
jgi:hypothetical protein